MKNSARSFGKRVHIVLLNKDVLEIIYTIVRSSLSNKGKLDHRSKEIKQSACTDHIKSGYQKSNMCTHSCTESSK